MDDVKYLFDSCNFPQSEGKRIYHYTSENGVLGILQKDKIVLQLTKADSLNDTSEGVEIFKHLEKACANLLQKGTIDSQQLNEILKLEENCNGACLTSYFTKDLLSLDFKDTDAYIMSFCESSDSLPMWNYYANYGNQGYCLHFNRKYLECRIKGFEYHSRVEEVFYNENDKISILETLITDSIKNDDYVKSISDGISIYQHLFKHSAFEHEKEIRLIVNVPKSTDKPTFETKFKTKNGYIVPYIELEIIDSIETIFLFNGITIGPLANKELANKNIKMYLEKMGYVFAERTINNSEIPVRF